MAGWNAEMNACPEADSFMVELRIDVFQDVKAMKEHKVDIEMTTIIDMAKEMMASCARTLRLRGKYMKDVSQR